MAQAREEEWAALALEARGCCRRFFGRRLPPGSTPSTATIGFEGREDGSVLLLVERGVIYSGPSADFVQLVVEGQREYPSIDALRLWLRDAVAPLFAAQPQAETDLDLIEDMLSVREQPPALIAAPDALLAKLEQRVCGQPAALDVISRRVAGHLARRAPARPLTLFAMGPTGVGKTLSAAALADALNDLLPGEPVAFLRLDMSEYQERHRVSQLLGAPQGYVGHDEGAELPDLVARRPRAVILFDEIEKAHPDVLRALMNVIDAGRLTTAGHRGRSSHTVDFRQTILFFTSNIGAERIGDIVGENGALAPTTDAECRNFLRSEGIPSEIVGRIGAFAVFHPLTVRARAEAALLALTRAAREYGLTLERVEPSTVAALMESDAQGAFGVRPMEFRIEECLAGPFAEAARRLPSSARVVVAGPPFRCEPA